MPDTLRQLIFNSFVTCFMTLGLFLFPRFPSYSHESFFILMSWSFFFLASSFYFPFITSSISCSLACILFRSHTRPANSGLIWFVSPLVCQICNAHTLFSLISIAPVRMFILTDNVSTLLLIPLRFYAPLL